MVATGIVAISRNRVTICVVSSRLPWRGPAWPAAPRFPLDAFKSTPPTVQVQLDSIPSGADAKTSLGPGCKTPCSVAVPAADGGFTVTYTLNKFLPVTVPVQVINIPGDFSTPASTTIDPNPVVAELKPAGPPPKAGSQAAAEAEKAETAAGCAAAPAASPFPAPPPPAPPADRVRRTRRGCGL